MEKNSRTFRDVLSQIDLFEILNWISRPHFFWFIAIHFLVTGTYAAHIAYNRIWGIDIVVIGLQYIWSIVLVRWIKREIQMDFVTMSHLQVLGMMIVGSYVTYIGLVMVGHPVRLAEAWLIISTIPAAITIVSWVPWAWTKPTIITNPSWEKLMRRIRLIRNAWKWSFFLSIVYGTYTSFVLVNMFRLNHLDQSYTGFWFVAFALLLTWANFIVGWIFNGKPYNPLGEIAEEISAVMPLVIIFTIAFVWLFYQHYIRPGLRFFKSYILGFDPKAVFLLRPAVIAMVVVNWNHSNIPGPTWWILSAVLTCAVYSMTLVETLKRLEYRISILMYGTYCAGLVVLLVFPIVIAYPFKWDEFLMVVAMFACLAGGLGVRKDVLNHYRTNYSVGGSLAFGISFTIALFFAIPGEPVLRGVTSAFFGLFGAGALHFVVFQLMEGVLVRND